jgi:8-oxo-dGTP pyrophosphatase MutT (NUDIX family)
MTSSYNSCINGCCKYEIRPYQRCAFTPKYKSKAGVFVINKTHDKILLVQSRGNLWGPPKGSVEPNETTIECAIREVFEETGLKLTPDNIGDNRKFVYNGSHYYYHDTDEVSVTLDTPMNDLNDASGIGWFKIDCLIDMIKADMISINFHCKLLLEYYLKLNVMI